MTDFYYTLLFMSVVAAALYLILRLLSKWTQKYFTATWHYYSHVFLYTLFFIPYFKLVALLNLNILPTVPKKLILFVAPIQSVIQALSTPMIVSDTNRLITAEQISHETRHSIIELWHIIPYVFVFGTIVFLVVTLIQNIKIRRRIFSLCELTDDPEILRELTSSKRKLGKTKEIPVYLSPYISSPFLYGMFKPRIVLPATMEFTVKEYRLIFLHELTHYKRRDVWIKCLLICVNALHWFNPLAYLARRDVDRYCELSCDEKIVQSMNDSERRRYCELLLNVLWNVVDQKIKIYSAFSDKRTHLERRIQLILKNEGAKRRRSIRLLAIMATLSLVIFGTSAVYAAVSAHDAQLKSQQELGKEDEYVLLSDARKNSGSLAVEKVTTSSEYFHAHDEIKPGVSKRFGGYALHKGDVVSLNYAYTGGGLRLYLLDYDAQTLEDGRLIESNSSYTIPEDGNYYFLLQNRSEESSENVKVVVQVQVNS
jgi:beta-lactamase regulating signal transducer with metallopeptidase domain